MEWLLYLAATHADSKITVTLINNWLKEHECKVELKTKDGKIEKPSFNGGYQCDLWFEKDNVYSDRSRWQAFVEFVELKPAKRAKLAEVWRTYETVRALILKQMPTKAEREFFGAATFQHFVAYRRVYSARFVHLYSHLFFAHAPKMMERLGSIGLYRNEAEEAVNSEHKRYIDNHSAKGGFGRSMCLDVMMYSLRKMFRAWDDAGLYMDSEELASLEKVSWSSYVQRARAEVA